MLWMVSARADDFDHHDPMRIDPAGITRLALDLGGLVSRSLQAAPQRVRPTAVVHRTAPAGSPPPEWMLAANVAGQ